MQSSEDSEVLGADRPQTGDETNAGAWAGVMAAAGTAMAGLYLRGQTKRKKEDED